MRPNLTSLILLIALSGGGWVSSANAQGAEERTFFVEGRVQPAGILSGNGVPSRTGSKIAAGHAEVMLSRYVGLRLHGYAQFTDPWFTEKFLDLRATSVMVGVAVHFNPGRRVDPYFVASAGGLVTVDNGLVRVLPQVTSAAGVNVHVSKTAFLHAEASWQIGNALVAVATHASDVRVTAGVGIRFDLFGK